MKLKKRIGAACVLLMLAGIAAPVHSVLPVSSGDDRRVAEGFRHLTELRCDRAIMSLTGPYTEAVNGGDFAKAARYLLLMAYAFRYDDNDAAAADCCLLAARLDNTNLNAKVMAAECLSRAGRPDEAQRFWDELHRLPKTAMVLQGLSAEHSSRGRSSEAEQCLHDAVLLDPADLVVQHRLAGIHWWRGEVEPARYLFEQCAKLARTPYQSEIYKGMVAETRSDFDAAEQHYLAAGKLLPEDPAWHDSLGMLYMSKQQKEKAKEHLQKAVSSRRLSSTAWLHWSAFLSYYGDNYRAQRVIRRLSELKPYSGDIHHALGTLYKCSGRINEAESEYRKSLALCPRKNQTYSNLISLPCIRDNRAKVREIVQLWKQNNPLSWQCLSTEGKVLMGEQQWSAARKSLEMAEKVKPEKSKDPNFALKVCTIYSGLANCSYHLKEDRQAIESAKLFNALKPAPEERAGVPVRPPRYDFAALKPDSPELKAAEHGVLADALFECGELEGAASHYNKALAYEPENIVWHAALLKVYIDKRDIAGAAKEDAVVAQHMMNKIGNALNFGKKQVPVAPAG